MAAGTRVGAACGVVRALQRQACTSKDGVTTPVAWWRVAVMLDTEVHACAQRS